MQYKAAVLLIYGESHCGDQLISTMVIPTPVERHLYIESSPGHNGHLADDIFKRYFCNRIKMPLKSIPKSHINNKLESLQVLRWRMFSDKPLHVLVITFTDTYVRYQTFTVCFHFKLKQRQGCH